MDMLTYEQWKQLPGNTARKQTLIDLRRNFEDKEIRESWGMKPSNWYNLVSRYMKGSKESRGPGRPKVKSEPDQPENDDGPVQKRQFQEFEEPPQPDEQMDVERERVVIDAEWTEVGKYTAPYPTEPQAPISGPQTAKKNVDDVMEFPFPLIKGTPDQLEKQFEAVVMFLEGNESEDTRFEIRLSVVKA